MSDEIMEEAVTEPVEQETAEVQDVKTFTQDEVDPDVQMVTQCSVCST